MVYILLCDGFEEMEAITPYDLLARAGIEVRYLGVQQKLVTGGQGTAIMTHGLLQEADLSVCRMIVLPGGRRGVENLLQSPEALEAVRTVWAQGGYVAAICAAPTILAHLGIAAGKQVTCYPDDHWTKKMGDAVLLAGAAVITDGRLITGCAAGQSVPFGLALIETLKGREAAETVERAIVWRS